MIKKYEQMNFIFLRKNGMVTRFSLKTYFSELEWKKTHWEYISLKKRSNEWLCLVDELGGYHWKSVRDIPVKTYIRVSNIPISTYSLENAENYCHFLQVNENRASERLTTPIIENQ